ncbi:MULTISPECIES: GspH/FimT family pseudopilin [unclassified Pseudoxanthomonas]|uniref:GspH/FimT family pseudopilin n=1 Tax=unclassified Pseudoxanthomonas TaxID=2645906 RepID=UPI0008E89872|nr:MULTISPECIES: GspH/FimT family pseudopilin [unclassified Pseudoxanthomonas]SFV35520.1 type IV fimbrial biogenesis protein FimT [Pseudoxanthomonas sp. YR558]
MHLCTYTVGPGRGRIGMPSRRMASGFTLVELIITLAVLAVLIAMAVPSFTALINSNRLAAQSNELVAGLQEARLEALRSNRRVTVCRSTDGATCNTAAGATWTRWISFVDTNGNAAVDGGEVLLRSSSIKAPLEVRSTNQSLTFRADGMVRVNATGVLVNNTLNVCIPTTQPAQNKRSVTLAGGSRIAVTTPAGTGACP